MSKVTIDGKEVDITGVVSAKELEDLLAALRGARGGGSDVSKALTGLSRTTTAANSFLGNLASTAGNVAGAVGEMTGSIYSGTAKLSTSINSIGTVLPGMGEKLTGAMGSIVAEGENYVGVFRRLSQSGGGLNGDILELKNSAAQTRMTLDEFAAVTERNAKNLGAMGGSVNMGTRLFTQFSKELFDGTNGMEGYAQILTNMGMSTKDINDSLLTMVEIQSRADMADAAVRERVAKASVALSTEMDAMAKLTGKSKEALKEEMMASQRKGQVEAKFRLIEQQQGKEAAEAARAQYAQAMLSAKQFGPNAVAALEETFVLGGARSKQAQQGIVAMGEAADVAQTTFRAIASHPLTNDINSMVGNMNSAIMTRMNDPNFLNMSLLAGADNPFGQAGATMLESGGQLQTAVMKFMEAGDTYADAYRKAREQIAAEQDGRNRPGAGRTPGADLGQGLMGAELQLKNLGATINDKLIGPNGAINQFAEQLRAFNTSVSGLTRAQIDAAAGPVLDTALGSVGLTGTGGTTGPVGDRQQNQVTATAAQSVETAVDQLQTSIEANAEQTRVAKALLSGMNNDTIAPRLSAALQEGATAAGQTIGDYIKNMIETADWSKISEHLTTAGVTDQNQQRRMSETPTSVSSLLGDLKEINANAQPVERANGSLGSVGSLIENFGKGTSAILHGNEGVITAKQLENMAAGVSNMMKNNVQSAPMPDFSGIQSSIQEMMTGMQGELQKMAQNPQIQETMKGLTDMLSTKMDENRGALDQLHNVARKQVGAIKSQGFNVFAKNILG